jgi:coenzyme PQQ biosynthesis protein PqqD
MTRLGICDVLHLPHGVRLKFDRIRNVNVLLAPERAYELDGVAAEVLGCVDGKRSISEIVDMLATKFSAERAIIETDVIEMLDSLVSRRVLEASPQSPATQLSAHDNGS